MPSLPCAVGTPEGQGLKFSAQMRAEAFGTQSLCHHRLCGSILQPSPVELLEWRRLSPQCQDPGCLMLHKTSCPRCAPTSAGTSVEINTAVHLSESKMLKCACCSLAISFSFPFWKTCLEDRSIYSTGLRQEGGGHKVVGMSDVGEMDKLFQAYSLVSCDNPASHQRSVLASVEC